MALLAAFFVLLSVAEARSLPAQAANLDPNTQRDAIGGQPIVTTAINVATNPRAGTILVDAAGRTVYMFGIDEVNKSNCTNADCLAAWPPVEASAVPAAGAGITAARLEV